MKQRCLLALPSLLFLNVPSNLFALNPPRNLALGCVLRFFLYSMSVCVYVMKEEGRSFICCVDVLCVM